MKRIQSFRNPRVALVALVAGCLTSLALAGNASAVSFSPAASLTVGQLPYSVSTADFNGDGNADLTSANTNSNSLSILLGDGAGGFGAASSFAVGSAPWSVLSADFDGDGNADLASSNTQSNSVSVLLGDGAGGFGAASSFAVGNNPRYIVSADFNGDGNQDIASSNNYSDDVSILLGDGAGNFGTASSFPVGDTPYAITTADFNGDGKVDLATANYASNDLSVLLGDGLGNFGPPSNLAVGDGGYNHGPASITSADLNGDGFADLISAQTNMNQLAVLLGDGTGNFGSPTYFSAANGPFAVISDDFDGDGNPDLATANRSSANIAVLLGDGAGGFAAADYFPVGTGAYSLTSADFNGDGAPDLASSHIWSNNLSVLLNTTPVADVKITKTAAPSNPRPGDTVTYTLKAKNVGTAPADDVLITDSIPVGLTFVSADAPCVEAAATVTCEIGTLAPGEEKSYEVKVTVDPFGTADPSYDHLTDVQRVEVQVDLNAGEQKTVQAGCPSGFFATDGSVRIDHIDQGTGDWTAPQVLESRASSRSTWQGTVKNTASGRAQAKIFAVCVRETTSPNGHSHNLIVSDPITVSNTVAPGRREATLLCGPGQTAIQPGFISSAPADLVYSEPQANGWKFALDVKAPSDVTFSIRCLTRRVAITHGHTHDLKFEHIAKEFTVQPGKVNEAQLTCADGYKGIVADMDLDHGLISLGNDPRPVTRAFKLYNPTAHALRARLSLLCLGDRTGGEHAPPKVIVNTANISTSSNENATGNNMNSATVTAEDTDNFTPVPNPPIVKPTPNNPIAMKIAGSDVSLTRNASLRKNRVTVRVNCAGRCSGMAKLISVRTVKVGKKKVRKGSVLAKGKYRYNSAGKRKLNLKLTKKGRIAVKKTRKALLKLSSGEQKVVRIR